MTDLRTLAQAVWRSTSALSDAFKDGHPGGDVPLSAEQENALATRGVAGGSHGGAS